MRSQSLVFSIVVVLQTYLIMRTRGVYLLSLLAAPFCHAGTPAPARFFEHQLVNHLDNNVSSSSASSNHTTWSQRYYVWEDSFQGPGSPILMIMGGEGAIEPETGLLYPFVTHHLARALGAYVLQPEHRFYGASQPISRDDSEYHPGRDQDPRVELLTSEQALYDAVRLLNYVKRELGCSNNSSCPVVTIGGSYPGFLSAMARVVFPQDIDMAYAASAPMAFYSQTISSPTAYYDHITAVAERAVPGCAAAVKTTLLQVQWHFRWNVTDFVQESAQLGLCEESIPDYIQDAESFLDGWLHLCQPQHGILSTVQSYATLQVLSDLFADGSGISRQTQRVSVGVAGNPNTAASLSRYAIAATNWAACDD